MAENNVVRMEQLMAVKTDSSEVLGKFLYFSLSNILVNCSDLEAICQSVDLKYAGGKRTADGDAFRSATGDINKRIVEGRDIFKVYCRDNQKVDGVISRELVKETLGETTNRYKKLANIYYDTGSKAFGYDNVEWDSSVDPYDYCRQARDLFQLYQECAGKKQIERLADAFLDSMDAVKISIHGRLFFVPRHRMHLVSIFEDFVEALNAHNKNTSPLTINSMYVLDDDKQRDKMADEFYIAVRKEIETYQEKVQHLIQADTQSVAVMDRWVRKIDELEAKKRRYEELLSRELDRLNDDFETLRLFSQELQVRARKIEMRKSA